jgi:hypothetical protein
MTIYSPMRKPGIGAAVPVTLLRVSTSPLSTLGSWGDLFHFGKFVRLITLNKKYRNFCPAT